MAQKPIRADVKRDHDRLSDFGQLLPRTRHNLDHDLAEPALISHLPAAIFDAPQRMST